MMKITAILILCIIAGASAQFSCSRRNCVKAGEVCGATNANTTTGCRGDSVCVITSAVSTGLCQPVLRLGDTCDSDLSQDLCESGTRCTTTGDNSICALRSPIFGTRYPGEKCNNDLQCRSYSSPYGGDDAIDGCRSGRCHHIDNGDYCTGSGQCHYEQSYCGRDNRCTKYIKSGGACFMNDETGNGCGKPVDSNCMPNSLNGVAGTCQKLHSQKAGEFCTDIDDCKEGLWCRTRIGDDHGTCTEVLKSGSYMQACNPLIGCNSDNNEQCQCTTDEGYKCVVNVRPSGYHGASKNMDECSRKHCSNSGNFNCLKDKCKDQSCKMNKLSEKSPTHQISCQAEGVCNSAFTLIASPILALLAIAFLAL